MTAIDELNNLLNQDIRRLETLANILEQEKALLASPDLRTLETLTGDKNRLLEQLRQSAKAKIRSLVAMGYRQDCGEPSRFIRSAGMTDLLALWQEAEGRLKVCQELNQINGRVISHLQKRLARLTDIFRGVSAHQKLYGAQGEQKAVSHSTILASA